LYSLKRRRKMASQEKITRKDITGMIGVSLTIIGAVFIVIGLVVAFNYNESALPLLGFVPLIIAGPLMIHLGRRRIMTEGIEEEKEEG